MNAASFLVGLAACLMMTAACGDDESGSGGSDGGSASQGGSAGAGLSDCPGATGTCTDYCNAVAAEVAALACPNDTAYDVAGCVTDCEGTFAIFEAQNACVCEYHTSLSCPAGVASCWECGMDGTWSNTATCCEAEVTAVQTCASNL